MRTIRTLMAGVTLAAVLPMFVQNVEAGEFEDELFGQEAEGVALVGHHCDGDCCDADGCCDDTCCDSGCGCSDDCCDTNGCCGDDCRKCRKAAKGKCRGGWENVCNECGPCGMCSGYGCYACGWGRKGALARKLNHVFGVQGGSTHSPGHGYVLPVKRPIWDVSYPYNHMYNATAVGAANGQQASSAFGNVYMPTDTTQLGYTYGHVPYWMPRANMVPPTPNPDAYHLRVCLPNSKCSKCRGGCPHGDVGGYCPAGSVCGDGQLHEVATEPSLAPVPQ